MNMQSLVAAAVLAQPGTVSSGGAARLRWQNERLASVQPLPDASLHDHAVDGQDALALSLAPADRLVIPALANAHDHARNLRSSTLGAWGQPLESWLPFLGVVPGADPYAAAATSFCRSVRGAATSVMVHYTRPQGGMDPVDEALAVARAARDVGIHIGFAVAMRDAQGLAYCDDATVLGALRPSIREAVKSRLAAPALPVAEHIARVRAVAAAVAADPSLARHVTVQYGPNGVQWCSDALLVAIAQASADEGRPVHMHLLETRYQREWADKVHPSGIVRHLDALGLLSPRLTLAHCAWARPDELELLAERGVTIAVNASSNLHLRSGIAPVTLMHQSGCRVAMGLDGLALDEDDDALREMRLNAMLHRGWGYEEEIDDGQWWRFAALHGRRSVMGTAADEGCPAAALAAGHAADFVVLDRRKLDDDDAIVPGVDPLHLLMARANASHVHAVVAKGRVVVRDGQVTGVDEAALRKQYAEHLRRVMREDASWAGWRETVHQLAEDLGPFYRQRRWLGCC